jgi:hypothetical protein
MSNWTDKSSNEILSDIQAMRQEHIALKDTILNNVIMLEKIEKDFNEAQAVLLERLKK